MEKKISKVIWDFDGVIVDSNAIRRDAFRYALDSEEPEAVAELLRFHECNGGLSRYVKFNHFCKVISPFSSRSVQYYLLRYNNYIKDNLFCKNVLVKEIITLVSRCKEEGISNIIVSGSDNIELNSLCEFLEIGHYFNAIYGSPLRKDFIISGLKLEYLNQDNVILVGDSINDYEAAEKNDIDFFGFNNKNLSYLDNYCYTSSDLESAIFG